MIKAVTLLSRPYNIGKIKVVQALSVLEIQYLLFNCIFSSINNVTYVSYCYH